MAEEDHKQLLPAPGERLRGLFRYSGLPLLTAIGLTLVSLVVSLNVHRDQPPTVTFLKQDLEDARKAMKRVQQNVESLQSQAKDLPDAARVDVDQIAQSVQVLSSFFAHSVHGDGVQSNVLAFVATANAQEGGLPQEVNKPLILYGVVGFLGLSLIPLFIVYLCTSNPEKMKFTGSTIQTILSFLTGLVAGMVGTGSA